MMISSKRDEILAVRLILVLKLFLPRFAKTIPDNLPSAVHTPGPFPRRLRQHLTVVRKLYCIVLC